MTMSNKNMRKRMLSLLLAVLMAFTGLVPAFTVFAEGDDGIEGMYQIELFYSETNTMVPTYVDDTVPDSEKQEYIEYMTEGQKLQMTYQLIDTEWPDNARIHWYSETPTLADVDENGLIKAFDSSKGAAVQLWIDNEVKPIPVVGSKAAELLEKAFYSNSYVDIDTLDTDAIMAIAEGVLGEDSVIGRNIEGYKDDLLTSLQEYLDRVNVKIHVELLAADGTLLDDDYMQVCVERNNEWYANFLPNGTHITNKAQIDTTVAKGSEVQLYAVTTPMRLHYKVVYTVKSSSIFDSGKVVATVNDSGLVKFKNTGTVTIVAAPDTEEIIENILKLINYAYALDNTGTIDSDKIAGYIIDYVGLDINRTVLAGIIDAGIVIKDVTQDAVDPVQLSATAIEIISNLVLQFVYNDSITFTVVEAQPLTDFSISAPETVKEGSIAQMQIVDIAPSAGDTSDITWTSSNPAVASVDENGTVTGRDAGGSLGQLSKSDPVTITAKSAANGVERSVTITVVGRTGRYLSDIEVQGPGYLEMGQTADYTYSVYPARVAESENLYTEWGIKTGEDEEGNSEYIWASKDQIAETDFASINHLGHYIVKAGGNVTIALHAYTGYQLSNGSFYEISTFTKEYQIKNGIPVEKIRISVTGGTSNGDINRSNTVTINGQDYQYVTIKKGQLEAYYNNGAKLSATVEPANATNQNVTWVVDNDYYSTSASDDTHTASITQNLGHESADTFNVYAVSADGTVVSNVITVCVTRKFVSTNTINERSISVVNGKSTDVTHTVGFESSAIVTTTGNCCYMCNWYSSDESVFTVEPKHNDNRDATITAHDVGTATLYCVSADGGITDSVQVTVYPDKEYLENIVNLCDSTVIRHTAENADDYRQYMHKLDLAYSVLYDETLASQSTCDTYAKELLYAFYKLGGFVGIVNLEVLGTNYKPLDSRFITVNVGTTANYKNSSYDFDFKLLPANAMYQKIEWTSSTDKINVDVNGKCTPASNEACAGAITCTVTDYMGTSVSSTVYIAFSKIAATGVTLDTTTIDGGEIGKTQQLTATVQPTGLAGASNGNVIWSSDDESIATVDENGVVTFVQGGRCKIIATTVDGGHRAECNVRVITNYSDLELLIKQYTDLNLNEINYYPDTWEAFQTALAEAQEIVTVRDSSQVQVNKAYSKLEDAYNNLKKYNDIQKIELYLDGEETKEFYQYDLRILKEGISYKNALLDLNARIYPNNGSYAKAEWFSSTDEISVTPDGKCSPTVNRSCYGRITCVVTDHFDRTFEDSVWVSFSYNPVTGVDLSDTSIIGEIDSTYQLTCAIQPTGYIFGIAKADIQDHYWISDDESIATVDDTGLVTFRGAGSTVVRCYSYDGGFNAACDVSSMGNRTELRRALEEFAEVDYKDFAYNYGMAFKTAYENATNALTEVSMTQAEIDSTTQALIAAYNNGVSHPFISANAIVLNYSTTANPLIGSTKTVVNGATVNSRNAISINLSSNGYESNNTRNTAKVVASTSPANAMYDNITFTVLSSTGFDTDTSSGISFTPGSRDSGGWARVKATLTDPYGRTLEREFTVTMSDNLASGITLSSSDFTMNAGTTKALSASVSGSPEFSGINWSSSNTDVAIVNSSGVVTGIDKGTAVITATSDDGGYSASVNVNVLTDFSQLAAKYNEYYNLIEEVKDDMEYTQDSLDALSAVVAEAKVMIDENTATQAEVDAMLARLNRAYAGLIKFEHATGVSITYEADEALTEPNGGFLRYTSTYSVNGKFVNLYATEVPLHSTYKSITWSSSNPNITVDETGFVQNNSALSGVAEITATLINDKDEEYTTSVYVSFVRNPVASVTFNEEQIFGAPTTTAQLNPDVKGASTNTVLANLTVKDCKYISSNPGVASVDENGLVTFNTQGSAVITAVALDGGICGNITAYTTWDTSALKTAIDEAKEIDKTDYKVAQGNAFAQALENAEAVYADVTASQELIDDACARLTEAMAALEGNEFIAPEINVLYNGAAIGENALVEAGNSEAVFTVDFGEGAMIKSNDYTVSDENGITVNTSGNTITAFRTADEGTFTITANAVDEWDREYSRTYTVKVIEGIILATDFAITVDGEVAGDTYAKSCGGSYDNISGVQFGYVTTPADANSVTDVTYTSSRPTVLAIDENGLMTVTTAGRIARQWTITVTVTITNSDGSTLSKDLSFTITKA